MMCNLKTYVSDVEKKKGGKEKPSCLVTHYF